MATEPVVRPDVLVVGASGKNSLGHAIVRELHDCEREFGAVNTAGITDEDIRMDLLRGSRISEVLTQCRPDIVVCTVGVNTPVDIGSASLISAMEVSFAINVTGPMDLLRKFVYSPVRPERGEAVKKFVAISSNSARIARRNSIAYCASKAALSMALRVAARELAGVGGVVVWGYEPGLLAGTPMTRETIRQFGNPLENVGAPNLHRMPGVSPEGLPVRDLARRIVQDLTADSFAYNGLMIPFDAGEL